MTTTDTASEGRSDRNDALHDNPNRPIFETKPTTNLPAVVACGYKRINIPKSGNSFPAFLIAFKEMKRSPTDTREIGVNSNDAEDEISPFRGVRFAWRSKKDFLILARKCGGRGNTKEQQQLPKAALKKITEETVVPWKRSPLSHTVTGAVDHLSASRQKKETAPVEGVGHYKSENKKTLPHCLCDPHLPNRFSKRMKKSIWQVDRFLQSMEKASGKGNSEQEQNAWEYFCRHSDTEDLVASKAYVATLGDPQKTTDTNTQHGAGRDATYKLVCDTTSSSNNIRANNRTEKTTNMTAVTTSTPLRESSRLGQYFASKQNARKVVECALEKVLPLYYRGDTSNEKDRGVRDKILFVEPSCGHGDVVVSLVEALKLHEIPPRAVWIMGYDIDPGAIDTCRHRKELLPGPTKTSDDNSGSLGNDYPVLWECKSFFETRLSKCIEDFDMCRRNDNKDDTTGATACHHGETQPRDRGLLICCLGGPPYTTGPGCGSNIKIDLPERFVDHCFTEWKADVVSFLLPNRYKDGMTNPVHDECTSTTRQQAGAIDAGGPTNDHRAKRWSCETRELEASTFFFRGTTKVTQPSIIQIFSSSESGKPLGTT